MLKLDEIKTALIKTLKPYFPDVHLFAEDVLQAEAVGGPVYPALHIQLVPMGADLAMGADTKDKDVLVDMTYIEETRASNRAMYEIRDRMEEALGIGFPVRDRFLHIQSIGCQMADDQMHITFHLEYNDDFPKQEEHYELFEQLTIRMERTD